MCVCVCVCVHFVFFFPYSNEIVSLPDVDTGLVCLKELHISKNCISEFPLPFLAGLTALEILEASWNRICML